MADTDSRTTDPRDAFDQLGRIMLAENTMETVLQHVAELAKTTIRAPSRSR